MPGYGGEWVQAIVTFKVGGNIKIYHNGVEVSI